VGGGPPRFSPVPILELEGVMVVCLADEQTKQIQTLFSVLICSLILCSSDPLSFPLPPFSSPLFHLPSLPTLLPPHLVRCCKETMTCSRWWRERLMCLASWRILPSTPVLDTLSDPAKSTRFSLDLGERNNRLYYQSNVYIQPLL